MAATVGSVNVKVMPSMTGFAKGVDSALGSAGKCGGKRFGEGFEQQAAPAAEQAGRKAGSGFNGGVSATGGKGLISKLTGGLAGVASKFSGKGTESGKGFASGLATGAAHLGGGLLSAAGSAVSGVHSALTGGGSRAGSGMGSAVAKAFSAKTAAIIGVASGIAQKVVNVVASSVGSAVSRVDTLNNFPKVLQNLGYGADESQASIDALSDRLSTLPTKLDDAAAGVQMLAPSSKSITQATDRWLAFNDAVLAGGTSEDVQANAMQQLTKAVSTNKMEMDTWMSIQQAMPGQLDQVAKHMLGSKASASDLYQALKKGKVSVSAFADAIVDLDQNGADGITSFSAQAQDAVGGIKTSWSNMCNAFPKGVAKIIGAIGSGNIVSAINGVKSTINGAFTGVVEFMTSPVVSAAAQTFSAYIGQGAAGALDLVGAGLQQATTFASNFLATLSGNGGAEAFAGLLSTLGQAASDLGDAFWGCVSEITGWKDAADGGSRAADAVKAACDAAQPAVQAVADAMSWLKDHSEQAAPWVEGVGIALLAVKVAGGPVGKLLTTVGKGLLSLGKNAKPASTGMGEAGESAALSAPQILALGGAVALVGVGVLAASAGLWLIAQAAVSVASAGPMAAVGMLAMVAAVAGLAYGASVLGPALTSGAVGIGVFGAAVALVGVGVLAASAGILVLSAALPGVAAYGQAAGAGLLALSVPLLAVGVGALAAGLGLAVLAVGLLACGAAGLVCAAAAIAAGAGILVAGAGTALLSATGAAAAAGLLAVSAASLVCAAGAVVLTAGLLVCSAGLAAFTVAGAACAVAAAALGVAIAACAVGLAAAAVAVGAIAAGMVLLAASASVTCGAFNQMAGSLPAVAASGAGAAASLALVAAACPAAASAGSSVGSGMGQAASSMGTAMSAAFALAAAFAALGSQGAAACAMLVAALAASSQSTSQLGAAASSAFSSFRQSAQSAASSAVSAVATACARMRSEVASCRMTLPRISVGALPHFSMSGSFNAQTGSVPSVSVSWYANGAVFGPRSPRVIGIGDNRRYDEAALPLSPQVLGGIGEGVAATMGDGEAVLAWLERRLGPTISRYAPTTTLSERESRRRAREALA